MRWLIPTFGCLFFVGWPLWGACSKTIVKTEADLAKVYYHLRRNGKSCGYGATIYLQYATRGILAGRLAEAYWAARTGENTAKGSLSKARARVLQSRALLGMGRYEEAIRVLKPLVTDDVAASARYRNLQERGHLAMIKAYYDRAGKRKDRNVAYLVNLFRNRYPQSRYLPLLKDWAS